MKNKSPSLALIRQSYTPFGGAERFVERALQALTAQGAELTLITRQWNGDAPYRISVCNPFYLGRTWRDWSFARCVRSRVATEDFDLVQSHERIDCCDIYRAGDGVHREWLIQRRRLLGPWARIGQALNPYHRYLLAAERRLFASPRLKAVICISHMVKNEVQQHFNLGDDKLHVLYNGIDSETFHPRLKTEYRSSIRQQWRIPQDAPLFLFVGSGFQRKGVPALLKAMAQLPANSHLLIVGKDKRLQHYQHQSQAAGLNHRVRFTGPQQDVKPFYGAADVLVFPTLYEPFGNVVLEAMAAGLPVITTTKCGGAELIKPARNGYICDALDVEALAGHMRRISQGNEFATMAAAARETVTSMTLERMAQQLLDLYSSLITADTLKVQS